MTDRVAIETNFRHYFGMYDGSSKKYGSEEEKLVNALFHDSFAFSAGDKTMTKEEFLETIKGFLSAGLTTEILEFKFLDDTHAEYKVKITKADGTQMLPHSVGTFKDGKLLTIKPFDEHIYVNLLDDGAKAAFETNFRQYFGMFIGSSKKYGSEEEKFFDALFHDDFSFSAGDKTVMRSNHLDRVKALLSGGLKAEVLMFKFINDTHAEYKVHLINPDGTEMFPHAIGTIKDGKLLTIKPFDEQVYVDLLAKADKQVENIGQSSFESKISQKASDKLESAWKTIQFLVIHFY